MYFNASDSELKYSTQPNSVSSIKSSLDLIKGLLIEYILNSKKISIRWKLGDKTAFTIVVPNLEADSTFEFMRAYALGQNDNFL
jgi:hypothetical protein